MEQPLSINGMDLSSAKEYIYGFISTLKLTEKQIQNLDIELDKWNSRIELAKSKMHPDLVLEAEKEVEMIKNKRQQLTVESKELKFQIEEMQRQLPLLAAHERSIDPDMLEQELLITAGYLPGEEESVRKNRLFNKMEKDAAAEAALSQLKAKMGK
jgi:phage shock protein A